MANIKLQLDPADKILLKRKLNKNGEGQRFLTAECRRRFDPRVPALSGTMKDTAMEKIDRIEYIPPYSRRQYYENQGKGLRGKEWDKRTMATEGKQIVEATAKFVGGKAK